MYKIKKVLNRRYFKLLVQSSLYIKFTVAWVIIKIDSSSDHEYDIAASDYKAMRRISWDILWKHLNTWVIRSANNDHISVCDIRVLQVNQTTQREAYSHAVSIPNFWLFNSNCCVCLWEKQCLELRTYKSDIK